jgi:hypothetical protein
LRDASYPVEVRLSFEPPIVTEHLQAIITVLSLLNPFMCAAMFMQIEAGRPPGAQMGPATKVALAVFVILTVAALVRVKVLPLVVVATTVNGRRRLRARHGHALHGTDRYRDGCSICTAGRAIIHG